MARNLGWAVMTFLLAILVAAEPVQHVYRNVSGAPVPITIEARLEDPAKRTVIWEETELSQWGNFDAATETDDDGKQRAIEKLAEDIVNRTIKGW